MFVDFILKTSATHGLFAVGLTAPHGSSAVGLTDLLPV